MSTLPQVQISGNQNSNLTATTQNDKVGQTTTSSSLSNQNANQSQTNQPVQSSQTSQNGFQPNQTPQVSQRPSSQQQPMNSWNSWGGTDSSLGGGWGNDSFNDYWGGGGGWGGTPAPANNQPTPKKMTPEERVQMIEKVYQEVLDRMPDTRDINYYKYSTLGEEEIKKQLIQGKEHKDLISHGKEYSNLRSRAEESETRVKMLEGQIKDQIEEFRKLTELLKEKNRYIEQLRQELKNPLNLPKNALQALHQQEVANSTQHFSTKPEANSTSNKQGITKTEKKDKITIVDRIVNAFGG